MRDARICQAIEAKVLLQVTYDMTQRLVEPHAFGVDKVGNELLRAWQQSPLPADWRTFRIDKISALALTRTPFGGPRVDYVRDDKQMTKIYCQL
jgi:predicted DNA-binding transcriptional regulator YafY